MKKTNLLMMGLAILLVLAVAACGGDKKAEVPAAQETAVPAETAPATDTGTATEVASVHDCDGACGMKNVAMDHLTEIDGKYYCAGCATKAKSAAAEGHGNG